MIGMHTLIPLCFIKAMFPMVRQAHQPSLSSRSLSLSKGLCRFGGPSLRQAQGTVSVRALMYFLFKNNFVKAN
jgi:hypothetical protein